MPAKILNSVAALWIGAVVGLSGCRTAATAGAAAGDPQRVGGYGLLYELCSKQSGVGRALWVVSAGPQTQRVVRAVAADCDQMAQRIERRAEAAVPPIPLDASGLPAIEIRARQTIESRTTGAILFGSDRERDLVLSQLDATRYAAALAEALARREPDKAMRDDLDAFARQMRRYHDTMVAWVRVVAPAEPQTGAATPQ